MTRALALLLLIAGCGRGEITVVVENATAAPLEGVSVHWESHSGTLGRLEPGTSRSTRLAPQPESGARVRFAGPEGAAVTLTCDMILPEDARGTLTLRVRSTTEVACDWKR
jgi:hypothetical protein